MSDTKLPRRTYQAPRLAKPAAGHAGPSAKSVGNPRELTAPTGTRFGPS